MQMIVSLLPALLWGRRNQKDTLKSRVIFKESSSKSNSNFFAPSSVAYLFSKRKSSKSPNNTTNG